MKLRTIFLSMILLGSLAACKKDKTEGPGPEVQADANSLKLAEDNNDFKESSDQVNTDVADALGNFNSINGRVAKKIICGCSIDSIGFRTIRLTYDGVTPCGSPSRTRAGKITIQLVQGNRWYQQGSVLKINLDQYTVTRIRDNVSWTFIGDKYLTNVNGTNWLRFVAQLDSLLYRERAQNIMILHSSGATTNYNVARTTTWKYVKESNREYIQFAAMGDTTINNVENVDTWGTSRFGKAFTNHYNTRFVSDTYCGLWRPRSGEIQHRSDGNLVNLTLGVNQQGSPSTLDCAYGWKLSWNLANGKSGSKIFSY